MGRDTNVVAQGKKPESPAISYIKELWDQTYMSKQRAPISVWEYHKASLPMLRMISRSLWPVRYHAGQVPDSQGLSNTEKRVEGFPSDYVSTANLWPVDFCNKAIYQMINLE